MDFRNDRSVRCRAAHVLAVAILMCGCGRAGALDEGANTSNFTVSSDPSVAILKVTSTGGMTGETTSYSLYGDGRLVWQQMGLYEEGTKVLEEHGGLQVIMRREAELSFEGMNDLVATVVDYGLLEATEDDILKAMGSSSWHMVDVGTTTIETQLESLERNGEALGSVRHSIQFHAPTLANEQFPEVRPLQGITRLIEQMNEVLQASSSSDPDERKSNG